MSDLPRRIVLIGASSPEGQGDPEGGGYAGRLARWYLPQGERRHFYNLGLSGDTLPGIIERLKNEVPLRKPHLILLHIGINDVMRTGSRDTECTTDLEIFTEHVQHAIQAAKAQAPVVVIGPQAVNEGLTTPVNWGPFYYVQADINRYTPAIREAVEAEQVPYVPIGEEWQKLGESEYYPLLAADGLHPGSAGHDWIFERVKAVLEQEFGL